MPIVLIEINEERSVIAYEIHFPEDFDNYAWEIESKGWFDGVVVVYEENKYELNFYDPVRLAQEIEDELLSTDAFVEDNLVVVSAVNRSHIEKAVKYLMASGKFKNLQKIE